MTALTTTQDAGYGGMPVGGQRHRAGVDSRCARYRPVN
jgi:hypothetical protein